MQKKSISAGDDVTRPYTEHRHSPPLKNSATPLLRTNACEEQLKTKLTVLGKRKLPLLNKSELFTGEDSGEKAKRMI